MSTAFEEANNVEINENVETTSALEALVGEGKKFGDAESLAKGKLEADTFILKLQQENAQLREQQDKAKTATEVLAEIKADLAAKENAPHIPNQNTTETPEEKPDLAAMVREELDKQNKVVTAMKNVETATEGLAKVVGADNVARSIAVKAKELGVSPDFLEDTARKSPKAFLSYFNQQPQPKAPSMTSGSVNTEALQGKSNTDSAKIDQQMRELKAATPRHRRNDPEYQKTMMDLHARKLGL